MTITTKTPKIHFKKFQEEFEQWFEKNQKNGRFDAEHSDAKDIAFIAAIWTKDFLENHK